MKLVVELRVCKNLKPPAGSGDVSSSRTAPGTLAWTGLDPGFTDLKGSEEEDESDQDHVCGSGPSGLNDDSTEPVSVLKTAAACRTEDFNLMNE